MPHEQDTQIILRTSKAAGRKASYVRAANRENQPLAAWCFRHLDQASGHIEPAPQPPPTPGGMGRTGSARP
ncbi:MAG: hypothetical protein WCL08_01105 [Verrucomicrobiota bacterium]